MAAMSSVDLAYAEDEFSVPEALVENVSCTHKPQLYTHIADLKPQELKPTHTASSPVLCSVPWHSYDIVFGTGLANVLLLFPCAPDEMTSI